MNATRPLLYTAQDVADFCEVDLKTVHHWADRGRVRCFRTEGRHLRFRRNDVVRFLREHGYPMPDEVGHARASVALGTALPDDVAKRMSARFAVKRHPSGVVAIAHLLADQPDALVLSHGDETIAGARTVAALKSNDATSWIVVVVIAPDNLTMTVHDEVRAAGADLTVALTKLPQELARALATGEMPASKTASTK